MIVLLSKMEFEARRLLEAIFGAGGMMPDDARPWWSRFTPLQLAIATLAMACVIAAIWFIADGNRERISGKCAVAYLVVMGVWASRRVARSLAVVLRERSLGGAAAGRVLEAAMLPIHCSALLLVVAIVIAKVGVRDSDLFLVEWFGILNYVGIGVLGLLASGIAMLSIWRRAQKAGWVAVTVAQIMGAVTVAAGFVLSMQTLRPVDKHDTWYGWPATPAMLWLATLALCVALGLLGVMRLWRLIEHEVDWPWLTLLSLVVFIGYLAGVGKLTGFWLSSWLYGAFFMARIATYVFVLVEPKEGPAWRSGWFACYVAAVALCIASTGHTIANGDFAMMMEPLLMMPLPPVEMEGGAWTFGGSLLLTLTRDMLLLVWLGRLRAGWGEAVGIMILVLLYEPIAIVFALLGWKFMYPVFYPLAIIGPVDLIWPVAMIGVLVALVLRSRRDPPATTSLA